MSIYTLIDGTSQHRQFGLDILSVGPRGRTDKTDKSF